MNDAAQPGPPVRPGDVLADKYEVERVIGTGGMGVVVAARHLQLGHGVAVKFLLPHACEDPECAARFLREAQAAVAIESEHVARVLDVGTLDSGAPYMVMELLVGSDLSHILKRRGPLPVEEAVDYVLQACEAIAEAHALGIVHRDLKPANLFVTQRKDGTPLVKVLDFGISKRSAPGADGVVADMTSTYAVLGSPAYMSPEQMRSSKNVDARTDIWALGVILYEALAGRPLFTATTLPALCSMIATDTPASVRSGRPEIPPELEAVVMECLQKKPSNRVRDIAVLAARLEPFGPAGCRVSVERISRVISSSPASAPTQASSQSGGPPAWGRTASESRSTFKAALVLGGVLLLGAAAAFFLLPGSRTNASAPQVSAAPDAFSPPGSVSSTASVEPAASSTPASANASASAAAPRKPASGPAAARVSAAPSSRPPAPSATYNPLDHL